MPMVYNYFDRSGVIFREEIKETPPPQSNVIWIINPSEPGDVPTTQLAYDTFVVQKQADADTDTVVANNARTQKATDRDAAITALMGLGLTKDQAIALGG